VHNPLDLDDDNLDLLKLDHLSWLRLLGEVLWIAPPYSNIGKSVLEISSHIHYHQMDNKIQTYDTPSVPKYKVSKLSKKSTSSKFDQLYTQ
jgi:hypothetical protein